MLSAAERVVGGAVALTLLAGLAALAQDEPRRPAPVVPAVVEPLPAPAALPSEEPVATPAPAPPRAAKPEPPRSGCPVPSRPGGRPYTPKPLPPPKVADRDLPQPLDPGPKATDLSAVSGKGVWVTTFGKRPLDVAATVDAAARTGARSVWVRTGGSRQGYYGHQFLPALVARAHARGLAVVAWDFPFLSDPVADAERARRALATGIDAFSPDVETTAEGTFATPRRVGLYLSLVRRHAGDRPVVATVPRPTPKRIASFPYRSFPRYADVFAPMVYWSCREPGALVAESLAYLGRMLPVHPVGQAYDMGSEGGRRGTPTRAETWRFLDASRRGGAVGAGLWTIEHAGAGQLDALADYPWQHGTP